MATASNWNVLPTHRRAPVTLSEKLRIALAEAGSAFGREHWQPWKFQIEDQFVELSMGAENGTETVADWREKIIHCGSALRLLKFSLKRQGCLGRVKLFPELDQPFLVARVYLSETGRGHEPDSLHFDDMAPGFFQAAGDAPVSETIPNLISHVVAGERCWLELAQGQRSRERLLELAGMNEQWLFKISGERPASPGTGQKPAGYNGWQKFILGVKLRAPVPMPETGEELNVPAMSGTFAVIKTKTDDKYGWMAAGQTSTLLLETARKLGISCAFFNQALRKPSVRQELRTSIGHKGFGQAIVLLKTAGHPLAALASSSPLPLRQTII